jgi:hypothetical protein
MGTHFDASRRERTLRRRKKIRRARALRDNYVFSLNALRAIANALLQASRD